MNLKKFLSAIFPSSKEKESTAVDDNKLFEHLANLFGPATRESAITKLVELHILDDISASNLRNILARDKYSTRLYGPRLANVKRSVDKLVIGSKFCFLNPYRAMHYFNQTLRKHNTDVFLNGALTGKNIIDYGCGNVSPFSFSLILFANGANSIYAVEPAPLDLSNAIESTFLLLKEMFEKPELFNLTYDDPSELTKRLSLINFKALREATDPNAPIDLGPIKLVKSIQDISVEPIFDLIVSISVLEHVENLVDDMCRQRKLLRNHGTIIHTVDLSDHRIKAKDYNPIKFYYDDVLVAGCNGLRDSDLMKIFHECGFIVSARHTNKCSEELLDQSKISLKYRNYTTEDLLTISAQYRLSLDN